MLRPSELLGPLQPGLPASRLWHGSAITLQGRSARSASPPESHSLFKRMLHWLSRLDRGQMSGFQVVVPFGRQIGVADKHGRRLMSKADCQILHRALILAEKHFCER